MRLFITIVILLNTNFAYSDSFTNLYLVAYARGGNDNCQLKQPKASVIGTNKSPLIFKGKPDVDACFVDIQAHEFKNHFEFCFMSGVKITGHAGTRQLKCDVSFHKGTWFFEAWVHADENSAIDRESVTCSYICKNQ